VDTEPTPTAGEAAPVRLTLELLPGSDPIAGSVRVAESGMRPFAGWIDLVAVIEEAIAVDPEEIRVPAREEKR
jgi:hypothetical protein